MSIAKNDRNLYTADEIMAKWRDVTESGWGMNAYEPNESDAERVAAIGSRAAQETAARIIAQAPFIALTHHMRDEAQRAETAKLLASGMDVLVLADNYTDELGESLGVDNYNGKSYGDGDIIWRVLVPELGNEGSSPLAGTVIAEGASDYLWLFDVRDALANLGLHADMSVRPENDSDAENDLQDGVDVMPYTAECFDLTVSF